MPQFTIYGARGTHPVSGRAHLRYTGDTSCFGLETPAGLLVIDAGTGITTLGNALGARTHVPPIQLLFTHLHLDHVIGLGAFAPLFRREAQVTLRADARYLGRWRAGLTTLIGGPFWPRPLPRLGARVRFAELGGRSHGPAGRMRTLEDVRVRWCPVRHPQGCLSYRLETTRVTVVIATDRECGDRRLDAAFLEFARGADILVHDAQYTPAESHRRRGWGHSTWEDAVRVARQARVGQLVLTSHDPARSDEAIEAIVRQARRRFRRTAAATAPMRIV